jgi:probable HAF family extracellular repeat protein
MVDLGTLGGPGSAAKFVNDAGTIVGTSDRPGHQSQHAFAWTAADGMVEMPSLGRLDSVWTMSANGSFAGFSSGKKSIEDQHAVLWAPAAPGGVK